MSLSSDPSHGHGSPIDLGGNSGALATLESPKSSILGSGSLANVPAASGSSILDSTLISGLQPTTSSSNLDFSNNPDVEIPKDTNIFPQAKGVSPFDPHVPLDQTSVVRNLNNSLSTEFELVGNVSKEGGDVFDPGGGVNSVFADDKNDVIIGRGGGNNTIATGKGRDTIILGSETTNKITDFDVTQDLLVFDKDVNLNNVVVAQGKNTDPNSLDAVGNTLIIDATDKSEPHILASLAGTKATDLKDAVNFRKVDGDSTIATLNGVKFGNDQTASAAGQQLNGTGGSDKFTGAAGNDILNGTPKAIAVDPISSPASPTGSSPVTASGAGFDPHIQLSQVSVVRNLNNTINTEFELANDVSKEGGDVFDPGGGNNSIRADDKNDVIIGRGGGNNTIATGKGRDTVILGTETTNKITDFDVTQDRLIFDKDVNLNNIVVAQGKNTDPNSLDAVGNTLILDTTDKSEPHILASLTGTQATDIKDAINFRKVNGDSTIATLNGIKFGNDQTANERGQQLNGTDGSDRLTGKSGDDALNGKNQAVAPTQEASHSHGAPPAPPSAPAVALNPLIQLNQVSVVRNLNNSVPTEFELANDVSRNGGDVLDPGAGNNAVIAGAHDDVIIGRGGGTNTISTGKGRDTVILGKGTTNQIMDFDPTQDRLIFDKDVDLNNIVIAQGKNPIKNGVDTALDAASSTLIIDNSDKNAPRILASLSFTKATDLKDSVNFRKVNGDATLNTLNGLQFSNQTAADGGQKLTGTKGSDRLTGKAGDDFLYVGDDSFSLSKATGSGPGEFPFPTDSKGTSEANLEFKNGTLKVVGSFKDFDGKPLFIDGETTIDPSAKILNGSDPNALVNGFLKVAKDAEGNARSGTHLHFAPSGDSRGNNADATIVRFFDNISVDAKSGLITGDFQLTPREQVAFAAGDLYINLHTNIDADKDGRGGFPTGENRLNLNQNIVKVA